MIQTVLHKKICIFTHHIVPRFSKKEYVLLKGYVPGLIISNRVRLRSLLLHSIKPSLLATAQAYLHSLQAGTSPVFIGVHVRRTDYLTWVRRMFHGVPVGREYFHHAMDYFSRKLSNPVFVVVTDDLTWCKENLGNSSNRLHFTQDTLAHTPELDLAVMSQTNHTSE